MSRARLVVLAAGLGAAACGGKGASAPPDAAPPFTIPALDHQHIGSDSAKPDFHLAHAQVDFGAAPAAKATLVVDLESPCFPFDKWQTDKPPAGQSWPADCDAFDRNFELTLDGHLELARLITPFGGPLHEEIDITDAFDGLPGPHDLQVEIDTWSDAAGKVSGSNGGWIVSAHVDVVPGAAPRHVLAVLPLFDGSITTAAPLAPVGFDVPAGATDARLEYRVTGHGGATDNGAACIGPAEEFCKRTHHVTVDGAELDPGLQPWRTDCASLCTAATYTFPGGSPFTYCKENPCGAMASVQAPRANWCPGSATPPRTYATAALHAAGHHTFGVTIDQENAGGTWRVSATLYVFGAP